MAAQSEDYVSVRLTKEQGKRLQQICTETGWTKSQAMRHLLDNAMIRPALIRAEIDKPAEREYAVN